MNAKDIMSIVQDAFDKNFEVTYGMIRGWQDDVDNFMKDCSSRIEKLVREEAEDALGLYYVSPHKNIFQLTDEQLVEIAELCFPPKPQDGITIKRTQPHFIEMIVTRVESFREYDLPDINYTTTYSVHIHKNLSCGVSSVGGSFAVQNQYKVQELFRNWNVKPTP